MAVVAGVSCRLGSAVTRGGCPGGDYRQGDLSRGPMSAHQFASVLVFYTNIKIGFVASYFVFTWFSRRPKNMGNQGFRFLRKVLKVRKVGMKSSIFKFKLAFSVKLFKIIQDYMTKSA